MKKEIKINLGCGNDYSDELIGFDIIDSGQQYVGFDMEKDKLPYKDKEVSYIKSNHSIEHIRDVRHIMNEAWRVLKDDGIFDIKAPYYLWEGFGKPVHYQMICACWFDFFRKPQIESVYDYKPWDIVELNEIKNKEGQIYEIHCIMKPKRD